MTAASLSGVPSIDLDIGGITCAACAGHVERALHAVPGVTEASVNLATEWTRVQGDAASDALIVAVTAAGYRARVATDETATPAVAEPNFQEGVGPVCIAAALPAPFVLPMIAGRFGVGWMLPPWVQWLLAAPVQFAIGVHSYKIGWKALRTSVGNMDLLVAFGTPTAYGLSL